MREERCDPPMEQRGGWCLGKREMTGKVALGKSCRVGKAVCALGKKLLRGEGSGGCGDWLGFTG